MDRQPSVLHVIGDGSMGGGTTAVLQMSARMLERGIRVGVATEPGSELIRGARALGIEAHEVDFSSRLNSPWTALRLWHVLKAARPDIVHAHGARAGVPCAMIPSGKRPPMAYTVHGFHYHAKPTPVRQVAMACERLCIRKSATTVFVSLSDRNTALRDGLLRDADDRQVFYNGTDVQPWAARPEPLFDVVFLGRLHPQKNPLILAEIARHAPGLRTLVIGDGDLMPALHAALAEAGLAGRFSFTGALPREQALAALSTARTMVLPSLWEGLPMAIIEAMHLGLPVVATDLPGLREMIGEGENGHLVPTGRADLFAARLAGLAADPGLARSMGEEARIRAAAMFSLDTQTDRHIALYRSLALLPARIPLETRQDRAA